MKKLYPLLTDAPLGYKSLWQNELFQGSVSCVGQEMWTGMKLTSLCRELRKTLVLL